MQKHPMDDVTVNKQADDTRNRLVAAEAAREAAVQCESQ